MWLTAVSILLAALTVVGCWLDGTLHSTDGFVGLYRHGGYLAMFILTPIIIFLTGYLIDEYTGALRNTRWYCMDEYQGRADKFAHWHLHRLECRARYWLVPLIIAIFFGCWILNYVDTSSSIAAKANFGNDVFDSRPHLFGFYLGKLYLFFVMVVVYPSAVFATARFTVSMNLVIGFINRFGALRIDLFHNDQCAGLSRFGNINLITLGIYAAFSIVSLATASTHTQLYLFMWVLFPLYLVAGFVQSWMAFRLIARSVAMAKRETLEIVTSGLHSDVVSWLNSGEFSSDRLLLRNYLTTIRGYPYAAHVRLYFVGAVSPLVAIAGLLRAALSH
jgi:hypothetical protein